MDLVRKICCCGGEVSDEEDVRQLIDDEEDDFNVITARQNSSNHYGSNGNLSSDHGIAPFMGFPALSVPSPQNVGSLVNENEENSMLDSILNQTQQNIIDVSNLADDTGISNAAYASQARMYNDVVRKHDNTLTQKILSTGQPLTQSDKSLGILTDVGNLVADMLSRPALSESAIEEMRALAANATTAVEEGIKIESTEELVVFMNLDD
ncbi:hypothetical protein L596_027670 [Steinernema carpocapsae]|uniref:Ragulator complex protein LAMTOR1 n=1 Tax=Steinernema carpocapsae TaxID=34508 RepID=A0A4U5LW42_STECR|nr:hypothetical protein L596_027670 [Steinernema carpocapsae]